MKRKLVILSLVLIFMLVSLSACTKVQEVSEEEAKRILVSAGRDYYSEENDMKVEYKSMMTEDEYKWSSDFNFSVSYAEQDPILYAIVKDVDEYDVYGNAVDFISYEGWVGRAGKQLVLLSEENDNSIKNRYFEEITRTDLYEHIHEFKDRSMPRVIYLLSDEEYIDGLFNYELSATMVEKKKIKTYEIHLSFEERYDNESEQNTYYFKIENGKLVTITCQRNLYEGLLKIGDTSFEVNCEYGPQNLEMPDYRLYSE